MVILGLCVLLFNHAVCFGCAFLFKQVVDVAALKLKTKGGQHLVCENWINTKKNGSGIGCPFKIQLAIFGFQCSISV